MNLHPHPRPVDYNMGLVRMRELFDVKQVAALCEEAMCRGVGVTLHTLKSGNAMLTIRRLMPEE